MGREGCGCGRGCVVLGLGERRVPGWHVDK